MVRNAFRGLKFPRAWRWIFKGGVRIVYSGYLLLMAWNIQWKWFTFWLKLQKVKSCPKWVIPQESKGWDSEAKNTVLCVSSNAVKPRTAQMSHSIAYVLCVFCLSKSLNPTVFVNINQTLKLNIIQDLAQVTWVSSVLPQFCTFRSLRLWPSQRQPKDLVVFVCLMFVCLNSTHILTPKTQFQHLSLNLRLTRLGISASCFTASNSSSKSSLTYSVCRRGWSGKPEGSLRFTKHPGHQPMVI